MKFTGKQLAAMPIGTTLRTGIPTEKYFAAMVRVEGGWENAWGMGWIEAVPGAEIDWDEIIYPSPALNQTQEDNPDG